MYLRDTTKIRGKCRQWLRKQYYNVVIEDVSGYDILAWKGKLSVGIIMLPDKESVELFLNSEFNTKTPAEKKLPAQFRVIFTFPGLVRNTDVPKDWGVIECYSMDYFEKKIPKTIEDFDELEELDILGKLLTITTPDTDPCDIYAIVTVFRDCFETSPMNSTHNELIDLISTGHFQYLLRGESVGK